MKLRCVMKQTFNQYLKLFLIYILSSLVCTLLVTTCFYFKLISEPFFLYINEFISCCLLCILCVYSLKKAEKKAFASTIGFLAILTVFSFMLMPFLNSNILYLLLKLIFAVLTTLIFLIRK